jgi:hypothetical protein
MYKVLKKKKIDGLHQRKNDKKRMSDPRWRNCRVTCVGIGCVGIGCDSGIEI